MFFETYPPLEVEVVVGDIIRGGRDFSYGERRVPKRSLTALKALFGNLRAIAI